MLFYFFEIFNNFVTSQISFLKKITKKIRISIKLQHSDFYLVKSELKLLFSFKNYLYFCKKQ